MLLPLIILGKVVDILLRSVPLPGHQTVFSGAHAVTSCNIFARVG